MKNNLKEILKLFIVLLSLFGIMFFFGWFTGASTPNHIKNGYINNIESYENDFVERELNKLNDKERL
jgi:energy-coupling factor transporter transmembrane protein EcfT